eukprot:COSAG06_NODE_774_length_12424_cov_35.268014_2_plen_143_part_00
MTTRTSPVKQSPKPSPRPATTRQRSGVVKPPASPRPPVSSSKPPSSSKKRGNEEQANEQKQPPEKRQRTGTKEMPPEGEEQRAIPSFGPEMQKAIEAVVQAAQTERVASIDTICADIQALHSDERLTMDAKAQITNLLFRLV